MYVLMIMRYFFICHDQDAHVRVDLLQILFGLICSAKGCKRYFASITFFFGQLNEI